MKNVLIPIAMLLCMASFSQLSAQVDIKINPLGLLFSSLNTGFEFGLKDNVGLELTPGFAWNRLNLSGDDDYSGSVFRIGANGRYYFNPKKGLDGFYAGVYTRYGGGTYKAGENKFTSTRVSGGFLFGGKIVARNEKLLFDFGLGFGRAFVYKFEDPDGTNQADLSDIPFLNWDIPLYIAIGYRIGGSSKK